MRRFYQTMSLVAISCFLTFAFFHERAQARYLPPYYSKHNEILEGGRKLDHVVLELNGQRTRLKDHDTLLFMLGDTVKIDSAVLTDSTVSFEEINLVGYVNEERRRQGLDDRGILIDTSSELLGEKWAYGEGKNRFAILVVSRKEIHGSVYLEAKAPALEYIEILVNDEKRVIRASDSIVLGASDQFKVANVVTNIKNPDYAKQNIFVEVHQLASKTEQAKKEYFEISVKHRSYPFATIPMVVEKL